MLHGTFPLRCEKMEMKLPTLKKALIELCTMFLSMFPPFLSFSTLFWSWNLPSLKNRWQRKSNSILHRCGFCRAGFQQGASAMFAMGRLGASANVAGKPGESFEHCLPKAFTVWTRWKLLLHFRVIFSHISMVVKAWFLAKLLFQSRQRAVDFNVCQSWN